MLLAEHLKASASPDQIWLFNRMIVPFPNKYIIYGDWTPISIKICMKDLVCLMWKIWFQKCTLLMSYLCEGKKVDIKMIITSWVHWERTLKVAWLWCYVCRKYQHALCTFKDTAYLVPRISLLPFPRRKRVKARAGLTMLASSRRSVNWGLARKTAGKKWKKVRRIRSFSKALFKSSNQRR